MMIGETVTVITRSKSGVDAFREPVYTRQRIAVPNVLVAPKTTQDLNGSLRLAGDTSAVELHFPKTFTGSLAGALVEVRGVQYQVDGAPIPYTEANTPLAWWLPVTGVRVDG